MAFRLAVSLLLGLVFLLVLLGAQHQQPSGWLQVKPIGLEFGDSAVFRGEEGQPRAMMQLPLPGPFRAERYDSVALELAEPAPGQAFSAAWFPVGDRSLVRTFPLHPMGDGLWARPLHQSPDWHGEVRAFGVMMTGSSREAVLVQRIVLAPRDMDFQSAVREAWRDWTEFEGWTGRSINFFRGWRVGISLSPVLVVALWVGISLLVLVAWVRLRRSPVSWAPILLIVLAGWFVLDVRWQAELLRQSADTRAQYSGKTWEERQLSAEDGDLFKLVRQVKPLFGNPDARVFVIGRADDDFQSLRAKYHVLPHPAHARLPKLEYLRDGDYVLTVAGGDRRIRVGRHGRLDWTPRETDEAARTLQFELLNKGQPSTFPKSSTLDGRTWLEIGGRDRLDFGPENDHVVLGYHRLRVVLKSPSEKGSALLVIAVVDSERRESLYVRRVSILTGPSQSFDMGFAIPGGGGVSLRIVDTTPGLYLGGIELVPFEDPRRLRVIMGGDQDIHLLTEIVLQTGTGTLYRVH